MARRAVALLLCRQGDPIRGSGPEAVAAVLLQEYLVSDTKSYAKSTSSRRRSAMSEPSRGNDATVKVGSSGCACAGMWGRLELSG